MTCQLWRCFETAHPQGYGLCAKHRYDEWESLPLGKRMLPKQKPKPIPEPPSEPYDSRGTRYGIAALRGVLEELSKVESGGRNNELNRRAWRVAQLVEAQHLSGPFALSKLREAGECMGLHRIEVERTLASAFGGVR